MKEWDDLALDCKRKRFRFGVIAAILGPVAVILLVVQSVAFPEPNALAKGLIAAEFVLLVCAVLLGYFGVDRRDPWLNARLRAEAFRRESFMSPARVGPYLTCLSPSIIIAQRLLELENPGAAPFALIIPEGPPSWRDELEDTPRKVSAEPEGGLPSAIEFYLNSRLRQQRTWYENNVKKHTFNDSWLERCGKFVLVVAAVMAAMHFMALLQSLPGEVHSPPASHVFIQIIAIVLPPIGSALIGLQSLTEAKRIACLYREQIARLVVLEKEFLSLASSLVQVTAVSNRDEICISVMPIDLRLRFKRLVLKTEELLANELVQMARLRLTGCIH